MKNILCIHDAGHDPASDDELTHSGLLSLINSNNIDKLTFIGSGVNPVKSNIIAKTQTIAFSKEKDLSYETKIFFYNGVRGGGTGKVNEPPRHLKEMVSLTEKMEDVDDEFIVKQINEGCIMLANAPGYALFLQNMNGLEVDFSKSTIIIQGATDPKQVGSTYNEKYGWSSLNERERYLNMFKEVYIHGRELAYKYFELSPVSLSLVGSVFKEHGYFNNTEDYVNEALCGKQSINFLSTGALTFSRIIKTEKLWIEDGPYAKMHTTLLNILEEMPKEVDYNQFEEIVYGLIENKNIDKDISIISETKHPLTKNGIRDIYDYLVEDKDNITGLAYRVLLVISLASGNELVLQNEETIIEFLKNHTKRTIYDPISLFIIHSILNTAEKKLFTLSLYENNGWNILTDIDIYEDIEPFSCLLKLF